VIDAAIKAGFLRLDQESDAIQAPDS